MKTSVIKTNAVVENPKAIIDGITFTRVRANRDGETPSIYVLSRVPETATDIDIRCFDDVARNGSGNPISEPYKTEVVNGHTVYYQKFACSSASGSVTTTNEGTFYGRYLFLTGASRVDILSTELDVNNSENCAFSIDASQIELSSIVKEGKRVIIYVSTGNIQTSWFKENTNINNLGVRSINSNMVGTIMDFVNSWRSLQTINLNFQRNVTGDLVTFANALGMAGARNRTYQIRLGASGVNYPPESGSYAFSVSFGATATPTITAI